MLTPVDSAVTRATLTDADRRSSAYVCSKPGQSGAIDRQSLCDAEDEVVGTEA